MIYIIKYFGSNTPYTYIERVKLLDAADEATNQLAAACLRIGSSF